MDYSGQVFNLLDTSVSTNEASFIQRMKKILQQNHVHYPSSSPFHRLFQLELLIISKSTLKPSQFTEPYLLDKSTLRETAGCLQRFGHFESKYIRIFFPPFWALFCLGLRQNGRLLLGLFRFVLLKSNITKRRVMFVLLNVHTFLLAVRKVITVSFLCLSHGRHFV